MMRFFRKIVIVLTILIVSAIAVFAYNNKKAEAISNLPSGFRDTTTHTGLELPVAVRFASDGRIFIAEKSGIIKVYDNLNDKTPTVFADLRTNVMDYWDRGLLGMALHPNFPASPYIYVLYTLDAPIGKTPPVYNDACEDPNEKGCVVGARLSRLTASGSTMSGSEQVLIEGWCQQYPSHSIGTLQFGSDGSLYVGSGDGASFTFADYGQVGNPCGDPTKEGGALRSQDIRTTADATGLSGTILRVDALGKPLTNNPLYGGRTDDDRIVAYGLRNPFRFTMRPGTNEIWMGEVGWGTWEEINRIVNPVDASVENFGWPCFEGASRQAEYDAQNLPLCENLYTNDTTTKPYYAYSRVGVGASISGLAFYTDGSYPDSYNGALFFTDYSQGWLKVMPKGSNGLPDKNNIQTFATDITAVELVSGPNNDIFYLDIMNGELHRIEYFAANTPPTARATANTTSGYAPLTVQFDGTTSSDPDNGDTLTYAWDLDGDGAYDDSTNSKPSYTFTKTGTYTIKLQVKDSKGATATDSLTITVGNTPPVAKILTPTNSTTYTVGETITFSGEATDPDVGNLPAANLSWKLIIHHCVPTNPNDCHPHILKESQGVTSDTIMMPDHGDPYNLEFQLTATSQGQSTTTSVTIKPKSSTTTTNTVIYDETLAAGWVNWSWDSQINFAGATNPFTGAKHIIWKTTGQWAGMLLHTDSFDLTGYNEVSVAIQATKPNQRLTMRFLDGSGNPTGQEVILNNLGGVPTVGSYKEYSIPMSALQASGTVSGFFIHDNSGESQNEFYVDKIVFKKQVAEQPTQIAIYDDNLKNGWIDWSWSSINNWSDTSKIQSGTKNLQWKTNAWYAGLYLHRDEPFSTAGVTGITFALQATKSNQTLAMMIYDEEMNLTGTRVIINNYGGAPTVGSYKVYTIPMSAFGGNQAKITGFFLQDFSGNTQNEFYVDSIGFAGNASPNPQPQAKTIYYDGLASGWENWSWSTNANFANSNPVFSGTKSIVYIATAAWSGLYLHTNSTIDTTGLTNLIFVLKASQTGQRYAVFLADENDQALTSPLSLDQFGGQPTNSDWKSYSIPLTQLNGEGKNIKGIIIHEITGGAQPALYIDELKFQ